MSLPYPEPGQAETFAGLLEAGLPPLEAIEIVAPGLDGATRQECAGYWPLTRAVRQARIALNDGKTWVAMTQAERISYTLKIAYNAMAYAVWSQPPSLRGDDKPTRRVLEFVDRLEKRAAGNVPTSDGWTAFLEKIATDQQLAQVLSLKRAKHEADAERLQ